MRDPQFIWGVKPPVTNWDAQETCSSLSVSCPLVNLPTIWSRIAKPKLTSLVNRIPSNYSAFNGGFCINSPCCWPSRLVHHHGELPTMDPWQGTPGSSLSHGEKPAMEGTPGLTDVIASENLPDGLGWTVPAYHSPISMDRKGQSPEKPLIPNQVGVGNNPVNHTNPRSTIFNQLKSFGIFNPHVLET